jgi:hypothetical protein
MRVAALKETTADQTARKTNTFLARSVAGFTGSIEVQ